MKIVIHTPKVPHDALSLLRLAVEALFGSISVRLHLDIDIVLETESAAQIMIGGDEPEMLETTKRLALALFSRELGDDNVKFATRHS